MFAHGPEDRRIPIAAADSAYFGDGALRVFGIAPPDSAAVANDFAAYGWYDFSQDGKWLAYWQGSSSLKDTIQIVPSTGGQPILLGDAEPAEAWWAPGPIRLAFARSATEGGRRDLWVVSPREAAVRITDSLAGHDTQVCGLLQVFSPDGTQIAFLEDTAGNGELRLVVATLDGARRELVRPPTAHAVRALVWSPDAKRIAYALNLPPQNGTLGPTSDWSLIDATTGATVHLGPISRLNWSPDGTRLFHFQRRAPPDNAIEDLHERAADGSGDRVVASTSPGDEVDWAAWNPAGGGIAFVTGRFVFGSPLRDALSTLTPGSAVVALADVVVGDANRRPLLSWSPDGQWLVIVRFDPVTHHQELVLETPDGSRRVPVPGAADNAVRFFGWSGTAGSPTSCRPSLATTRPRPAVARTCGRRRLCLWKPPRKV